MPYYGTKCGVYEANETAGTEVSSTYEGRHLTVREDELKHVAAGCSKGTPVMVGENIVGVAFTTPVAVSDLVAIDTEGIWNLSVMATDDDGDSAVAPGDEIYINKTTCILSKNRNKNTHQRFGYALGTVQSGMEAVIAVKVHWNPDDAEEMVGADGAPYTSTKNSHSLREYRYRSSATLGDVRGIYMALHLAGILVGSGEAGRHRTIVEAAVANAHGCHDGIEFAAGGSISGLGVGHRATLLAKNGAMFGTCSGGMSEMFAEGASTNYAGGLCSIHRFINDGNGTGKLTAALVWEFSGLSPTQLQANAAWANAESLRCIVNGNIRYVGLSLAA